MGLNFTDLLYKKNVKDPGLKQEIFGVRNDRFWGWDLTLENGTCTGLGTMLIKNSVTLEKMAKNIFLE